MRLVKIETLMNETNMNESELALYVGVSVSMISKLRHNNIRLSENVHQKFKNKFGEDIEIMDGMPYYKELFLEQKERNKKLKEQLDSIIFAYNSLVEDIDKIRKICEGVIYE